MGKPGQRAVDILGLQHQSGRYGSRASGRTSKESIANGGPPTAPDPDISFDWGYATVSRSAKKIKGLPESDFIVAGSWRARSIGCSIARIRPSTISSEKLRRELASLSHGGNERSHRHRVRR